MYHDFVFHKNANQLSGFEGYLNILTSFHSRNSAHFISFCMPEMDGILLSTSLVPILGMFDNVQFGVRQTAELENQVVPAKCFSGPCKKITLFCEYI